ncbi:hypothetical protein TB1_007455 [Malus domestica]
MLPVRRSDSSPRGRRRLMLSVGLLLYWRACRASLKEKDRVNFERCLCEALGVGLEASQSRLTFKCSGVPLPSSAWQM